MQGCCYWEQIINLPISTVSAFFNCANTNKCTQTQNYINTAVRFWWLAKQFLRSGSQHDHPNPIKARSSRNKYLLVFSPKQAQNYIKSCKWSPKLGQPIGGDSSTRVSSMFFPNFICPRFHYSSSTEHFFPWLILLHEKRSLEALLFPRIQIFFPWLPSQLDTLYPWWHIQH